MSRTSIVIPCYNEAARLDVERFVQYALTEPAVQFYFVNDGSTDTTLDLLAGLHEFDVDRFHVVDLTENSGKAEAVRRGVLAALDHGTDYVGYWDADLATPLEAIESFRKVLDERSKLELVMGARVRLLGRSIRRKAVRHILGRIFATGASWTLGLGVYDTQCGAKLFRVSRHTPELFRQAFATNWIFDVELIARMIARRRHTGSPPVDEVIYELPLTEWQDVGGSKVRPRDFFKALFELVRVYRRYLSGSAELGENIAEPDYRPVGTFESSPAIDRWKSDRNEPSSSPVGTTE